MSSSITLDRTPAGLDAPASEPKNLTIPQKPTPPTPPRGNRGRKLGFLGLGIVILAAAIGYGVTAYLAPPSEETDDAYVGGDIVAITARDGGTVLALHADNTQAVTRNQPLIDLDPATTDVSLAAAEARLGSAVRMFRAQRAEVDEAAAEVSQAQTTLDKARRDLTRRSGAARDGAVSGEEVSHASDAVRTAEAALTVAKAKQAQAASMVAGTDVTNNPAVLSAVAAVRQAAIDSSHMKITAPVAGVVAQRNVQLGQRVSAGTPLMAVVPLDSLWVDANFRETQLQNLRVGQPADIIADVYGSKTVFHGHVLGLGAGSGNAFALLPPQNASGNWIKIVQRVPVRIALDPAELAKTPLRIGLSVDVTVSTSDRSGPFVSASTAPAGGTEQSLTGGPELDGRIQDIIAQNMGGDK